MDTLPARLDDDAHLNLPNGVLEGMSSGSAPVYDAPDVISDRLAKRSIANLDRTQFLNLICPGPFLEIRFIYRDRTAGRRGEQRFLASVNELDWSEVERMNAAGFNAYYGVGARKNNIDGTKDGVKEIRALWVDLDAKDFDPADHIKGKDQAFLTLSEKLPVHLQPSVVVDSGGGYHAYWVLQAPFDVTRVEARAQAEAIMRGLGKLLNGDSVHDIGRVLRLPGSLNVKNPDELKSCTITSAHLDRRFTIDDFKHLAIGKNKTVDVAPTVFADIPPTINLESLRVSADMKALIQAGKTADGRYSSRSEAHQAVITALINGHHSPDEIRAAFLDPEWRIGDGYKEKPDRDAYLSRSIASANAFIKENPAKTSLVNDQSSDGGGPTPTDNAAAIFSKPLSEIFTATTQTVDYLVDQLLRAGGLGFCAGEAKRLKSWLLLSVALDLSRGTPVFGHFAVPTARKVLFVEEEDSESTLAERIGLLSRGSGHPLPSDDNFRYAVWTGMRLDPAGEFENAPFKAFVKDVAAFRPDLVIIDAFHRVNLGEENSQKDMGRVMQRFAEIRRVYGCSILLVHHFGKPGQGKSHRPNMRMRGSSALSAWSENSLYIMSRDQQDTLRIEPESKFAQTESFAVKLEKVENPSGTSGLRFAYLGTMEVNKRAGTKQKVLDAVLELHTSDPESCTVSGLKAHLSMSEGTVRNQLKELRAEGKVSHKLTKIGGQGQEQLLYRPGNQEQSLTIGEPSGQND